MANSARPAREPKKIYGVGTPSILLFAALSLVAWIATGFYNVQPAIS